LLGCLLALALRADASRAQEDLAKESQNPIGNLISLPFENSTDFGVGPEDAVVNVLDLKPVYPVGLGGWNLINRAILPLVYQGERVDGEGSQFGLGNLTYQAFFSPTAHWPAPSYGSPSSPTGAPLDEVLP
jgi:hypothetical protein